MLQNNNVAIIGVPTWLGQKKPGVAFGPDEFRYERYQGFTLEEQLRTRGYNVFDMGNIAVPPPSGIAAGPGPKGLINYNEICTVSFTLAEQVREALKAGYMPLVLGGDHSLAIGSISGVAWHYHELEQKIGVVWPDAHTDINGPNSSESLSMHGTPVAYLTALNRRSVMASKLTHIGGFFPKIDGRNLAFFGVRDISIDPPEFIHVREIGATMFRNVSDCSDDDIRSMIRQAIAIACKGTAGFHLSLDIDFLDASLVPGTGTPVEKGVSLQALRIVAEEAFRSGRLLSVDVAELNPEHDENYKTFNAAREFLGVLFSPRERGTRGRRISEPRLAV